MPSGFVGGGLTFLEFFAGAGLVRLALEPEWRCLWANDSSPKKAAAYRANFGASELQVGDVARISSASLPNATMAWASFPCQDLSLAGWRRGLRAERSGTFWAFWRLMRRLKDEQRMPRLVVLENVVGLLSGGDFVGLCEALAALDMSFGALVVNGDRFVPQSRPRVFVVASEAPPPTCLTLAAPSPEWHPPSLVRAVDALPPPIQPRWTWWSLPSPGRPVRSIESLIDPDPPEASWLPPQQVARLCSMMTPRNAAKLAAARSDGRRAGFLYRRTREGKQRAEVRFDGAAGCLRTPAGGSSRQTLVVLDGDRVHMRLLTAREAARLMGVPDSYQLPSCYNDAYHAMGDGVVVPLVRWLGAELLAPLAKAADAAGDEQQGSSTQKCHSVAR